MNSKVGEISALLFKVYTVLVGANAAVVRAAIMGGLSIFARQVGRQQHGLNSLGFVAAVTALFNPHVLWDISFQLSFMATLGLIWDALLLQSDHARGKKRGNWRCYNVSSVDK